MKFIYEAERDASNWREGFKITPTIGPFKVITLQLQTSDTHYSQIITTKMQRFTIYLFL